MFVLLAIYVPASNFYIEHAWFFEIIGEILHDYERIAFIPFLVS